MVSKQKLRQAEAIQLVRLKRESVNQNLGFASRPFVLCGLPIKRPAKGVLMHERRNGQFLLQVTGHPTYGVPWGQDRLVPIFLATLAMRQQKQTITFRSAAEMLDIFGMQQGGSQYRRLIAAFQRVFGATIFFGTDTQRERPPSRIKRDSISCARRGSGIRAIRIRRFCRAALKTKSCLSDEFFREVTTHSIPTDLEAAKALSSAPAALDLFMWLSYRCFTAKGQERIPIFGDFGLGGATRERRLCRPRKFRERLERWLDLVRSLWPSCPAQDHRGWRLHSDSAGCGTGRERGIDGNCCVRTNSIRAAVFRSPQIDAVVSARLGPTRILGNSQPACFNRQVAMYLARHVGRLEHDASSAGSTTVAITRQSAMAFSGSKRCAKVIPKWMHFSPS